MSESLEIPKEKPFNEIEAEMNSKGFYYNGIKSLIKFSFTKDARFVAIPNKSREDAIREEQEYYRREQGVEVEVELIDCVGLTEGQQAVHVFVKPKS